VASTNWPLILTNDAVADDDEASLDSSSMTIGQEAVEEETSYEDASAPIRSTNAGVRH